MTKLSIATSLERLCVAKLILKQIWMASAIHICFGAGKRTYEPKFCTENTFKSKAP